MHDINANVIPFGISLQNLIKPDYIGKLSTLNLGSAFEEIAICVKKTHGLIHCGMYKIEKTTVTTTS